MGRPSSKQPGLPFAMTTEIGPTDLAYFAGIVDNNAALRSRALGTSILPVVQVSGKYQALEWLGELTGTKVIDTQRGYSRHNCTEHCPDRHAHIQSHSRRWSVTGMRATIVLVNILPYLRYQHSRAQELVDHGLSVQYQTQVVNEMAGLGWRIPDLAEHRRARIPLAVVRE